MNVELRERIIGECTCGVPRYSWEYEPDHEHEIICDWGVIQYPNARPDLNEVGPLMLLTVRYWYMLVKDGPVLTSLGASYSAEVVDGRSFLHIDYERRWTWELFGTNWTGSGNLTPVYIGRWPD